jgi:hypothetical protein
MNKKVPDFFLASREGHILGEPRMCFRVKRVQYGNRDDCLLVHLEPSLDGRNYGIAGIQINKIVLATRFKGDTLFPPTRWPLEVYILRIAVNDTERLNTFKNEELINMAWGEIYKNKEEIPPTEVYSFGN